MDRLNFGPVFAAAFATHHTWETFLVGMAASVGAGISMGFAEALSDDGSLTGRGTPWIRGTVCGLMTTIGGIGHTLPYLIPDFWAATVLAIIVVANRARRDFLDRYRYMDTPFLAAAFQVVVGGTLVFHRRDIDRKLLKFSRVVSSQHRRRGNRRCFVLGHLSDSASGATAQTPSAGALVQRGLGYINWLRKRRLIHRADMLAR